jgi:tetratricopeptide (TPR) repeat protein
MAEATARCPTCGQRARRSTGCAAHGALAPAAPAESLPSLSPPSVPGYRVLHLLGHGGFGLVFAAERAGGGGRGARAAVKIARDDVPGAAARLRREIEALVAVGPPHVPAVYDAGELPDGAPFVAMAFVDAPLLADRLIEAAGPLPWADFGALARGLCASLAAAHERGFVHRDLKPENVFVDGAGRATIIDFGLVLAGAEGARGTGLTREGALLGTAEYMSPEQCDPRAEVDARTDVYAAGVILHEMLTGHPPFWGPPAAVHESHRSRRPPRLPAAPPAVEEVVLRCLAKAPGDRFADGAALGAAIERALADGGLRPESGTRPAPPAATPGAWAERRTVGLLLFTSEAPAERVRRQLAALGAEVAHTSAGRYAAVIDHDAGEHLVRVGERAARELVRLGLCERALVDLAALTVQARADGSKRYLSMLFTRADRYPAPDGPAGVALTAAARAALPEGAPSDDDPEAPPEAALVGRDDLIAALASSACRAAEERAPTLVTILGEEGHGKSHLCRALVGALGARLPGATVIALRAPVPGAQGGAPVLRELLRGALGAAARAEVAPVVSMALGDLEPDAPSLAALRAAPGALRSALIAAVGDALRRRAGAAPLLVVLDDAHFADDATLAALEYAALAEARGPLWICAVTRPGFGEARPTWGERAAHHETRTLGPLDAASAAALCRRLLLPAESVPEEAVARLVARAEAVPLLLVELIRGLRREGIVRRSPGGHAWYVATDEIDRLPDAPVITWFAERRVAALPPSLRAHARLAALLGEVTIAEIRGVVRHLDRTGAATDLTLDPEVATRRLIQADVLALDAERRVGFRQGLVREAFARSLPEPERRRLHRAVLEHYEDVEAAAEGRFLARIAHHAAEAGLGPVAARASLALGERARDRHAYVEAELHYSRALAQPGAIDDALREPAHRGRGLMRYRTGRYHDALEDLGAARALARARRDARAEAEILLDEATALDWMYEFDSSAARAEEAAAVLDSAEVDPLLRARLRLASGRSLYRRSRGEEAARELALAAEEAERLGDAGYETQVVARLMEGFVLQVLARLDDAERALDHAVRLCERFGDPSHLSMAVLNRAMLRGLRGDRAAMDADLDEVLALSRRLGNAITELMAEFNRAEFLYLLDAGDAAEPHLARAIALSERRRKDGGQPLPRLLAARLALHRGDLVAARARLAELSAHQAEARAAERTDALFSPSDQVLLDLVALALGDGDEAAWDALTTRSAACSVGQEQIEVHEIRALTALRRGWHVSARSALAAADAAAARIPHMMSARLGRLRAAIDAAATPAS